MRKIKIFDTTLRDGEQSPGCSMHISEKLDIAEALDRLGVDVIEAGFPASSDGDFNSVYQIAKTVKHASVCALSRCNKKDIDRCLEAIKVAVNPTLHLFIATSPIHLEYKLNMSKEQCLETIDTHVRYAKQFIDTIEFSFEDASRTSYEFLAQCASVAIKAGATTLNFPDTVGYSYPHEMKNLVTYIKNNVEGIDDVVISIHCHNDLGLAVANSLAAVEAGAGQIECTINGIGERAGNAALEELVMAIKTRQDHFDAYTDINTKLIYSTSNMVAGVVGIRIPPNKAIVGTNAFAHESGIHQHGILKNKATYEIMNPEDVGVPVTDLVIGKHSGKHAFKDVVEQMGYTLTDEQLEEYFTRFKEVADRKKLITRYDIEVLLRDETRRHIKRIYSLKDYEVTTYKNSASAVITLETEGKVISEHMTGDGPVDASFKAIASLTGHDFKLMDYQVHSVTRGKDALGIASIKLANGDTVRNGKGISTDVLEASLIAYINATNKLLQEG